MHHRFLGLFAALLLGLGLCPDSAHAQVLELVGMPIDPEKGYLEWPLDTLLYQQPKTRAVWMKNLGDAPLEIKNLESSCECTILELGVRRINPGDSAELRLTHLATGAGAINTYGILTTNAQNYSTLYIRVLGLVQPAKPAKPSKPSRRSRKKSRTTH